MKNFLSLGIAFLLSLISISSFAQQDREQNIIRCYTVEHEAERRAKNANLKSIQEFEEWLAPLAEIQKKKMATKSSNVLTIPCVVHILHNGEAEGSAPNITDAQAISQIQVLNEDFGRTNPDIGDTRAEFLPIAADVELRFVMAQTNPDGMATNGVVHHNIGQDGVTRDDLEGTIKPNTIWDPTKYLNMWAVKFAAPDDNLLGYAQFPEGSGLTGVPGGGDPETDGIVIRYLSFGTINGQGPGETFLLDNTYNLGRTGTHEVGHWVGLRHTWGDMLGCSTSPVPPPGCSCTVDDFCDDTPNSDAANYGCALTKTSPCSAPETLMTTDQIENYMDYTNDACMNMFSNDQKIRVQTVMANSPRRMELPNSEGLFPPGTYVVFQTPTQEITEGSNCDGINTIDITMTISAAPSATTTVSFTTSGTATEGTDYTFANNTLTFPSGSTESQTLTLNVREDFNAEGDEIAIISIDEVNGSDALKGFAKHTLTLTINDDDFPPLRAGLTTGEIVYSEDFDSGASGWSEKNQTGSINWYEGINLGLFASIGDGRSAFISTTGVSNDYNQFVSSSSRYVSPAIDTRGISNLVVSFDYVADGEQDDGGVYDYGSFEYSIDGINFKSIGGELVSQTSTTQFTAELPSITENITTLYLAVRWDNDNLLGSVTSFEVDNIQLSGSVQGPVDISITNDASAIKADVGPNEIVHFYDGDNKIIATLENGNQDLGCTSLTILTDGENANISQNNIGLSTEAASKTIEITPSNNQATADYTLHFYYTESEINTWISDLASNIIPVLVDIDDFKIFKTSNTDVSAASDSDTQVETATSYETYNVNGTNGYRFSGDFTGFSRFGGANITFPFTVTETISQVTCNGGNDGNISLDVSGATGLVSFNWSNGTSGVGENEISNLIAGDYGVTISDTGGNNVETSYTVTEPASILLDISTTKEQCGGSDGTATATVSNATDYTIMWSTGAPGNETNNTLSNLAAGNYSAQIVDDITGCLSEMVNFTIENTSNGFTVAEAIMDASCNSGNNGSITLTPTNAVGAVNYTWSNGTMGINQNTIDGLSAGSYSVTASDQAGCEINAGPFIVGEPANAIGLTVNPTDANCGNSDGSATALATNVTTTNYIIEWSTGATGNQDNTTLNNLAADNYTAKIIDDNSCESTIVSFTVADTPNGTTVSPTITNAMCHGGSSGAINLVLSGSDFSNPTFLWSANANNATTAMVSNLAADDYTVTVTNDVNCQQVLTYTVGQPANPITATFSTTNANCGAADGEVTATITNTTSANYTLDWSTGATGDQSNTTLSNLAAGSYSLKITDDNCESTDIPFTITNDANGTIVDRVITNVTCNSGNNGSISLMLSGADFDNASFLWSANANNATTAMVNNLAADDYTVTVTNNVNCQQVLTYTVTEPENPIGLTISTVNANCNNSDGSATATVTNTTNSNYMINWSTGANGTQDNRTLTGLAPDNYTAQVTDQNNCVSIVVPFTIGNDPNETIVTDNLTNVTCNSGSNGSINLTLSGADFSNPSFMWSANANNATTPMVSNLTAGTYMVTVTNDVNCIQMLSYTVTEPENPVSVNLIVSNANCGAADGEVTAVISDATHPNYTINWSTGATGNQDNRTLTGLAPNSYDVKIIDNNSCESIVTPFTIGNDPDGTIVSETITDINCNGTNTGAISLNLSGSDFNDASFMWSNNATTSGISNLAAGSYGVTVTNSANCVQTLTYMVNQPTTIDLTNSTTNEATDCNNNDGSISVTPTGGTPNGSNYNFVWSTGSSDNSTGTTATLNGLDEGTYTVSVTDANNCTETRSFSLTCTTAVPVQLMNFTATITEEQDALLAWEVNEAINFSHYEILRSSDTKNWIKINTVSNNSNSNYTYTDQQLLTKFKAGNSIYYQLKIVDLDGSFEWSPVRSLVLNTIPTAFNIFPNPSSGAVTVQFTTEQTSPASLKVMTLNGQIVQEFSIKNPATISEQQLDLTTLPHGVYFLQLQLDNGTKQLKIVLD